MKPTGAAIAILDPRRDADWPADTPPGIRRYLSDLVLQGPEAFVSNATGVNAELIRVGTAVVPLLVSDGRRGKASMLSAVGHHVLYPIDEIAKQRGRPWKPALRLLAAPALGAFRAGALDKIAFLNHWLVTGAPAPRFDASTWAALLRFVAERYSDHAVLVSDILPDEELELCAQLGGAGACAVPWRTVCVFDPDNPTKAHSRRTIRKHWQVGRALLRAAQPRQVGVDAAPSQIPRLVELYRAVYLGRHNRLNPDYTADFFARAISAWDFDFVGWTDDQGAIEAFQLTWWNRDRLQWGAFGLDLKRARDRNLYPLCMAHLVEEARRRGQSMQWGAGAIAFKVFRGARTCPQVGFVYCRHLRWHRRAVWDFLRRFREWRARHGAGTP